MAIAGVVLAAAIGGGVWLSARDADPPSLPDPDPDPVPLPEVRLPPPPTPSVDAGVQGTESIRGKVVTIDGRPVADVQVIVSRDETAPPRSAVTAADGSYEVTGLARGVHRLRVEGPGVVPAELRRVVAPDQGVDVVIARSTLVEGLVLDGGLPAAGATIELGGTALAGPRELATDDHGWFSIELPEGAYTIGARRGARAVTARIERFGAGPWEPVLLVLAPAALAGGRVVDLATGDPIEGARLALIPEATGAAPRRTTSGADGRWSLEGVAPGSWSLEADAPGYLPAVPQMFEAGEGMTAELAVVLLRGGVIDGRVIDRNGVAIAGARVVLTGETEAGRRVAISAEERARRVGRQLPATSAPSARLVPVGELGVLLGPIPYPPPPGATVASPAVPAGSVREAAEGFTTDADGKFRIDAIPPGRFVVGASHPEFAPGEGEPVTLRGASVLSVVVTLRRGAIVEGSVLDSRGAPVPNAEVSAREAKGAPAVAVAFTDDQGRYRLARLSGGVRLRAAARGHAAVEDALVLDADAEGRTIEHRFVLGAAEAEIAGSVTDSRERPIAGAEVVASGPGEARSRAITDAQGRFVLRGLPDGSYRVEARHPDFAPVSRGGVRAGEDRLELALANAGGIEGEVRDAHTGGPMLSFSIRARGPAGAEVTRSFEKGDFTLAPLAPGAWTLTVEAPGFATRSVRYDVPVAREPREPSLREVRIELRQGGTIAGAVYDEHGEPASGALVVAANVRATTDRAGRFRLTGVEPGDFPVRATHPTLGAGETPVAIRSGDEILTLEIKIAP